MEDTQALLEHAEKAEVNLVEAISGLDTKVGAIDAKLSDLDKRLPTKVEPEEQKPASAEQEQAGTLEGIARTEVWDIPLGKIAIGTLGGIFVSELVDGILAAQSNSVKGGIKLVAAGATVKWGKRWLGKSGAGAVALVLGVLGLAQVIPLDVWAKKGAVALKGVLPAGSLVVHESHGDVVTQAERVFDDYYTGLKGGAR